MFAKNNKRLTLVLLGMLLGICLLSTFVTLNQNATIRDKLDSVYLIDSTEEIVIEFGKIQPKLLNMILFMDDMEKVENGRYAITQQIQRVSELRSRFQEEQYYYESYDEQTMLMIQDLENDLAQYYTILDKITEQVMVRDNYASLAIYESELIPLNNQLQDRLYQMMDYKTMRMHVNMDQTARQIHQSTMITICFSLIMFIILLILLIQSLRPTSEFHTPDSFMDYRPSKKESQPDQRQINDILKNQAELSKRIQDLEQKSKN